jgi:hypothetical protein
MMRFTCMHTVMADDASIYVFHADTEGLNFRKAFSDAGFYLSGCCIWKKQSLVLGRSPYQWQHEPVLYGLEEERKARVVHRTEGIRLSGSLISRKRIRTIHHEADPAFGLSYFEFQHDRLHRAGSIRRQRLNAAGLRADESDAAIWWNSMKSSVM